MTATPKKAHIRRHQSREGKSVINFRPVDDATPWSEGDPDKKISINVPFPEPLMLQLDWLIEQRAIRSKSSFIRDAVAEIATRETQRTLRVQEAVRRIEEEDKA